MRLKHLVLSTIFLVTSLLFIPFIPIFMLSGEESTSDNFPPSILSQPPGGTFHKLSSDAILVVCSQTFALFWLIKMAVPVKIFRCSFRVFSCACPTVISSISGKSFHFPFHVVYFLKSLICDMVNLPERSCTNISLLMSGFLLYLLDRRRHPR